MRGEGRGVEVGAAEGGGGVAGVDGVGGVEELEDGGCVCPGGYGEGVGGGDGERWGGGSGVVDG